MLGPVRTSGVAPRRRRKLAQPTNNLANRDSHRSATIVPHCTGVLDVPPHPHGPWDVSHAFPRCGRAASDGRAICQSIHPGARVPAACCWPVLNLRWRRRGRYVAAHRPALYSLYHASMRRVRQGRDPGGKKTFALSRPGAGQGSVAK